MKTFLVLTVCLAVAVAQEYRGKGGYSGQYGGKGGKGGNTAITGDINIPFEEIFNNFVSPSTGLLYSLAMASDSCGVSVEGFIPPQVARMRGIDLERAGKGKGKPAGKGKGGKGNSGKGNGGNGKGGKNKPGKGKGGNSKPGKGKGGNSKPGKGKGGNSKPGNGKGGKGKNGKGKGGKGKGGKGKGGKGKGGNGGKGKGGKGNGGKGNGGKGGKGGSTSVECPTFASLSDKYSGLFCVLKWHQFVNTNNETDVPIIQNTFKNDPIFSMPLTNSTYLDDCLPTNSTVLNKLSTIVDDSCVSDFSQDEINWLKTALYGEVAVKCYTHLMKLFLPEYIKANWLGMSNQYYN